MNNNLVHAANEVVDLLLTVTEVTSLSEVLTLLNISTKRRAELEGPEEVIGLLEVGSASIDLVNKIFHADNSELSELLSNDGVISEGNTLLVNLAETALVNEVGNGLEVGGTISDIGLDHADHGESGVVKLNERTVVDLSKAKKLKDLLGSGRDGVDTADANDEGDLRLGFDEEVSGVLGLAASADECLLLSAVLLHVLFGALEDGAASSATSLTSLNARSGGLCGEGLLSLSLLELRLGNRGGSLLGHRGLLGLGSCRCLAGHYEL